MEKRIQNQTMAPAMALALAANFGSVERWREEFMAMGRLPGGSGRVALCFQPRDGTLANQPALHDAGPTDGAVPLLAAHIGAIDTDWEAVYERYRLAVTQASEPFGVDRAQLPEGALLDVRRAAVFEQDGHVIRGASWADPAAVGQWGQSLPLGKDVVVYCVYGHEVGRATALRLRALGLQAWFLRGGIDGWKAAGMPLVEKA